MTIISAMNNNIHRETINMQFAAFGCTQTSKQSLLSLQYRLHDQVIVKTAKISQEK